MKKLIIPIAIIIILGAGIAYAQSTATPVVFGFLSTTGCPGSFKSCWLPYSVSNPMPVISQ